MIDAAPLNVMDESPATWWSRGWDPPLHTHTSSTPAWCEGDTRPVSVDWGRNKGALNLGPINNAQLGEPFAAAAAPENPVCKHQLVQIPVFYLALVSLMFGSSLCFSRGCSHSPEDMSKGREEGCCSFGFITTVTHSQFKKRNCLLKAKRAGDSDVGRVWYFIFRIKKSWKAKKKGKKLEIINSQIMWKNEFQTWQQA